MDTDFVTWLTTELDRRGWSNSELARRADMVPSTISMVISEHNSPSLDFCVKIARAFGLRDVDVLRAAGLIAPIPPAVAREQEVTRLFREMPDRYRDLALKVLEVFATTNPASVVPNARTTPAPGDGIILQEWNADHPLLRVLADLHDGTEDEVRRWLFDLIVKHGAEQLERLKREGNPALT